MMNRLSSSQTIRDVVKKYGFRFTKSLGQNFLKDESVVDSIVDSAELTAEEVVLEIGPGIGVMTDKIAEQAGKVIAVEIDQKLIPILEETMAHHENIILINKDILKIDLKELKEEYFPNQRPKIIANLPYYITTPIIMMFLESGFEFDSMTVMMQKEVAQRIAADPGNKTYGALSVMVQYYTQVEKVMDVPRGSFVPEPDVESMVLRLRPHETPIVEIDSHEMFRKTVKAGFSTRRKTLLNALSNNFPKDTVREALKISGIDPGLRAEKLDIESFAKLANAFEQQKKSS